jgi:hypothetical protein
VLAPETAFDWQLRHTYDSGYGLQFAAGTVTDTIRCPFCLSSFAFASATRRRTSLCSYNSAMEINRDWYIRSGVYLTLERLQMLVYRTLFRKL